MVPPLFCFSPPKIAKMALYTSRLATVAKQTIILQATIQGSVFILFYKQAGDS